MNRISWTDTRLENCLINALQGLSDYPAFAKTDANRQAVHAWLDAARRSVAPDPDVVVASGITCAVLSRVPNLGPLTLERLRQDLARHDLHLDCPCPHCRSAPWRRAELVTLGRRDGWWWLRKSPSHPPSPVWALSQDGRLFYVDLDGVEQEIDPSWEMAGPIPIHEP